MATTYRKVKGRFVAVGKKKKKGAKKKRSGKNIFSIASRDKKFRAASTKLNQAKRKKTAAWKHAMRMAKKRRR